MLFKDDMVNVFKSSVSSRRNFYSQTIEVSPLLLGGAILVALLFYVVPGVEAGAGDNLSGWAWSETIGWISFNSTNCAKQSPPAGCPPAGTTIGNYGVNVAPSGDMLGYAWAETIGWISFNEDKGCPSKPCKPNFDSKTGKVTGWARALSAKDGWDGWIHLSPATGSSYGVSVNGCDWSGYAWGSDITGWINFKGSNYGVTGKADACRASVQMEATSITDVTGQTLTVKEDPVTGELTIVTKDPVTGETIDVTAKYLTINDKGQLQVSITKGESITLDWSAPKTSSCKGIGGYGTWAGTKDTSGPEKISPPVGNYTYTLQCVDQGGQTLEESVIVIVSAPECSDTINNDPDQDTLIDLDDPGCAGNPLGESERSPGILFTADRTTVSPGDATGATLTWDTEGYVSCALKDDGQKTLSTDVDGSTTVFPEQKTTYTFTCGSESRSITISVGRVPKFKEITPR